MFISAVACWGWLANHKRVPASSFPPLFCHWSHNMGIIWAQNLFALVKGQTCVPELKESKHSFMAQVVKKLQPFPFEIRPRFLAPIWCQTAGLWSLPCPRTWSTVKMEFLAFVEDVKCSTKSPSACLLLNWFKFYGTFHVYLGFAADPGQDPGCSG